MFDPSSTYRIQFHKDFTLDHFEDILPYLHDLGVRTVYASPIFYSVPGSMHGYDALDPTRIDPEIGTVEQLKKIKLQLDGYGMRWLQDIVPNHMAFHTKNKWLMDFFENGKDSSYANFFDIWEGQKPMVPFLGDELMQVIAKGELKITGSDDRLFFQYGENYYPLNKESGDWMSENNFSIGQINTDPVALQKIADMQYYELCCWKEVDHRISYRRFFTVNELICLNMQHQNVFDGFHKLISGLLREKIFDGLRIDHIDGLYDPEEYIKRLRQLAGPGTYIIAEKILEPGEKLSSGWSIQGTTGYEFLSAVSNLLTNKSGEKKLHRFYNEHITLAAGGEQEIAEKKRFIIDHYMQGELSNLHNLLIENFPDAVVILPELLKKAVREFLVSCPVYRYYRLDENIRTNIRAIAAKQPELASALHFIEYVLFGDHHDEKTKNASVHFFKRAMQFTGPLMAKGVEDTLMYTDNRFILHDEVGDSPLSTGYSVSHFHHIMQERQEEWPLAMNASSTHDTKRGEDARARLMALADIADEWISTVNSWQEINGPLKKNNSPDRNDEYLFYQSLLASYPMPGEDTSDFENRFLGYIEKALRESKRHSSWDQQDIDYENACKDFAKGLLEKEKSFWKTFSSFHSRIIDAGIIYSLSQLLLKMTCPSVPDTYQGSELWNFDFVDPDNRRAVDYEQRKKLLHEIKGVDELRPLWEARHDGRIKLWLTHHLLKMREDYPSVFSGRYTPLQVEGTYKRYLIAFSRSDEKNELVVIVPLHIAELAFSQACSVIDVDWKDTVVVSNGQKIGVQDHFKSLPLLFRISNTPQRK
jgi:malto-oligosyltrehalose synthase